MFFPTSGIGCKTNVLADWPDISIKALPKLLTLTLTSCIRPIVGLLAGSIEHSINESVALVTVHVASPNVTSLLQLVLENPYPEIEILSEVVP
jgi:hypothetical protein